MKIIGENCNTYFSDAKIGLQSMVKVPMSTTIINAFVKHEGPQLNIDKS